MSLDANTLIQYVSWFVYVAIFVVTTANAVRRPLRGNIDVALFFLVPTLIILLTVGRSLGWIPGGPIFVDLTVFLYLAMGYMLLRLVDDFADVPTVVRRGAEALLIVLSGAGVYYAGQLPPILSLLIVAYILVLIGYSIFGFLTEARRTRGVTQRRMRAAAFGSIALFLVLFLAGLSVSLTGFGWLIGPISTALGLASGVCYFLGFAPPTLLRRAWQEPELRAFLSRAATLPRLPTTQAIVEELEMGAATSLGTREAKIGLYDSAADTLNFTLDKRPFALPVDRSTVTARAFLTQKPAFTDNLPRDNPSAAEQANQRGAVALMVAPISTQERRLGVLAVYAPRAPIFIEDDLALVELLADQAAVILESRALIDEATRVRTREEVTRLKEDFLSAAAHDLKTPLTTLVAQAQLLQRRAERNPTQPADQKGLSTLVQEATRLKRLVLELLDAVRAEEGRILGELTEVDLVELAREVCSRHKSARHPCRVDASGPVLGRFDGMRVGQLLENLVENAIKYSPDGGEVVVALRTVGGEAVIEVRDLGIGIPPQDLPFVFERFHRGTNVDDRRFTGMGLGLYICKEIARQHGGAISVTSTPGKGTTFTVRLPISAENATAAAVPATSEQATVEQILPKRALAVSPDIESNLAT